MASKAKRAGAGSTLPAEIAAEITADWVAGGPVAKGDEASEVFMPMDAFPTFRSNRAFDCVGVARTAVAAAKIKPPTPGMVIGSKTWIEDHADAVDAVDEVKDADGNVTTAAVAAVPEVLGTLYVQTFWKAKT